MRPDTSVAAREAAREAWTPGRELTQSLFLIGFLVASVAAYVGLGFLAMRVLAG